MFITHKKFIGLPTNRNQRPEGHGEARMPRDNERGGDMVKTGVANVDGVQVAYRVQGDGPPVVLVNGTAALDVHRGPVIEQLGILYLPSRSLSNPLINREKSDEHDI